MANPMGVTSRGYGGSGDLAAMLELAGAAWEHEGIHEYPRGQLCWEVPRMADPAGQIRLWEHPDGRLVGFALFYPCQGHGHVVHPGDTGDLVGPQILRWSEARCAGHAAGAAPMTPDATASDRQSRRVDLLRRCGYAKVESDYMAVMRQPLDRAVDVPTLPAGYAARSVSGEHELPRRVAVQRAAFGPRSVTDAANYAAVTRTPDYRPDLDVVVCAPDGAFAAFALGWYDPRNRIGMIEPVGTDPAHRGKGLATAAVLELVRRLRAAGADVAQVCHDIDNPIARRAYESAGFCEVDRLYKYTKPVG